jgi:hypothetical protein
MCKAQEQLAQAVAIADSGGNGAIKRLIEVSYNIVDVFDADR